MPSAQDLLAARARRVTAIRQRVIAAVLASFVLAWSAVAWDGSMGAETTSAAQATTTGSTTSGADQASSPDDTYSDDSTWGDDGASASSSQDDGGSLSTGQS